MHNAITLYIIDIDLENNAKYEELNDIARKLYATCSRNKKVNRKIK